MFDCSSLLLSRYLRHAVTQQKASRGGWQSQSQVYERDGPTHDHHTHSTQPAGDHWTRYRIILFVLYTVVAVGSEIYDFILFALPAGEFGIVYKASLAPLNSRTDSRQVVAVKTLRGTYIIHIRLKTAEKQYFC